MNHSKLIAVIITIIVLAIIWSIPAQDILQSVVHIGLWQILILMIGLPPALSFMGLLIYAPVYILLSKGFSGLDAPITNATLTCQKGHKCRVWVNYRGDGWWYDFEKGGEVYHAGGGPTIHPETCPKCGAHWEVPHKHKKP